MTAEAYDLSKKVNNITYTIYTVLNLIVLGLIFSGLLSAKHPLETTITVAFLILIWILFSLFKWLSYKNNIIIQTCLFYTFSLLMIVDVVYTGSFLKSFELHF